MMALLLKPAAQHASCIAAGTTSVPSCLMHSLVKLDCMFLSSSHSKSAVTLDTPSTTDSRIVLSCLTTAQNKRAIAHDVLLLKFHNMY